MHYLNDPKDRDGLTLEEKINYLESVFDAMYQPGLTESDEVTLEEYIVEEQSSKRNKVIPCFFFFNHYIKL